MLSEYRMCSLSTECVLLSLGVEVEQLLLKLCRMCSLITERVLLSLSVEVEQLLLRV